MTDYTESRIVLRQMTIFLVIPCILVNTERNSKISIFDLLGVTSFACEVCVCACVCYTIYFKPIAIDTPGGNLNFVRNIKAQTTALNRAIT